VVCSALSCEESAIQPAIPVSPSASPHELRSQQKIFLTRNFSGDVQYIRKGNSLPTFPKLLLVEPAIGYSWWGEPRNWLNSFYTPSGALTFHPLSGIFLNANRTFD
jgi:hypothetical protein